MTTGRNMLFVWIAMMALLMLSARAFSPSKLLIQRRISVAGQFSTATTTQLELYSPGRSASRSGKDRSKRQYRVGQLVQSELGRILHKGVIKGDVDYIDEDLRQRISIISVDVAPDLRQARVTVSIRKSGTSDDNPVVDQRRAYSWLVENTKAIRHTLAQRMSHLKTSPSLTFVQVDVGAAVDVMYLIEKVTAGYQREKIGEYGENDNSLPKGYIDDMDFDEEFDEDEWDEEDDEFFENDE